MPLVSGMSDPWGPPERRFSGSGRTVVRAYLGAFGPLRYIEMEELDDNIEEDDAPVIIASHLVNKLAQSYFGDPISPIPILSPQFKDATGNGFEAQLRWTIYTPADTEPVVKLELFEGRPLVRNTVRHALADRDTPATLRTPQYYRQGEIDFQQDDYLLVTVLPRDARFDRRIVSLAGVSKTGTLAARLLFDDHLVARKILKEIDNQLHASDYYQALIHVKVDHSIRGYPQPIEPTLIDATPVPVRPLYGVTPGHSTTLRA